MSERKLLEAIRMRELVKALKESKDEIANLKFDISILAETIDGFSNGCDNRDDEIAKLKEMMLEGAKVLRLNMGGFDRVKAKSMAHKLEREAAK